MEIRPKHFKSELIEQIQDQLYKYYERQVSPVLILDEAQLIPGKAFFDEIRLLTNFQLDHTNLISVILIGQPELGKRLKHRVYAALNQRITIRFHLSPLDEQDVLDYLHFRWKVAGGSERSFPFTPRSVAKIFAYSGGVPRLINSLATTCLIDALGKGIHKVEHSAVDFQAQEIGLPSPAAALAGDRHGRHGRSA
jgi:type II secretory pathway predicted ATPase ExeA